jgi:hypothetical protein
MAKQVKTYQYKVVIRYIDNLDVNKMILGNFASVKIVNLINNQNVILNFANFATI